MVDEQLKREVDAYVDEVWEDVVADMDRLVRHDSVEDLAAAEPGKPWGPAAWGALVEAERMAERLGLEVTDVDGYLGFADVPGASGPERYVATIAHTDIVPTGEGWHFPPLEVTRKDGYLIGRGVQDDKGPFLSLQPQAALAMTPDSARRLASALLQALQQYDERFGVHQGQGAQN